MADVNSSQCAVESLSRTGKRDQRAQLHLMHTMMFTEGLFRSAGDSLLLHLLMPSVSTIARRKEASKPP